MTLRVARKSQKPHGHFSMDTKTSDSMETKIILNHKYEIQTPIRQEWSEIPDFFR